jgi:hypothetical protein
MEPPTLAHESGRIAQPGDDGRLLDSHRDQVIAAINVEVGGNAQRETINADYILNHALGPIEAQPTFIAEDGQLLIAQRGETLHTLRTLLRCQLEETRKT